MPVRVQLVAGGADLAGHELDGLADRARNALPATDALVDLMVEHQRRQWASDGARGGKPWPRNTVKWARNKARHGKPTRPMRYTGVLMESLTSATKIKGAIRTAGKQRATVGTNVFYAKFQPARLIGYTTQDVGRYQDVVVHWLMEGKVR